MLCLITMISFFIYCMLDDNLYVKMSNFPMLSLHVRAVHFSFISNLAEKRLAFVVFHGDEWMKNAAVLLQIPKLILATQEGLMLGTSAACAL